MSGASAWPAAGSSAMPGGRSSSHPVYGSRVQMAIVALITLCFLSLFWRWFFTQNRLSWHALEDWGHAYLIPLISGWMLWQKRTALWAAPRRVFWPGMVPFVFGVAAYPFLVVTQPVHMAQGIAWIVALYGLVLWLTGPSVARIAFVPIAFLAMGITVSERIMIEVTFQLQLLASQGSWLVLSLLGAAVGFGAEVDGNTILVTVTEGGETVTHPLNIAEACSGMRMVIAFHALAFAVGLTSCRAWWQRISIALLAGPLAVVMNIGRVVVLGLLTLVDPDLAAGEAHTVIGMILLVPSLAAFLGIVWLLKRLVRADPAPDGPSVATPAMTPAAPAPSPAIAPVLGPGTGPGMSPGMSPGAGWGRSGLLAGVTAAVLLGGSAAAFTLALSGGGIRLQKTAIYPEDDRRLLSLPRSTEGWEQVGSDRIESGEVVTVLGTPNYVSRTYRRRADSQGPGGEARPIVIDFHAAYYTGMIDAVPHVPERCFVGGGLQKGGAQRVVPLLGADASRWAADPSVEREFAGEQGVMYTVRTSFESDRPGTRVRLPRDVGPERPFRMSVSEFLLTGDRRLYAGYFFIANGGTVPRGEDVRALAFDLRSRYAYYLKVQVTSASVESAEELARYGGELIGELLPEIMLCVPDWIEIEREGTPRTGHDA